MQQAQGLAKTRQYYNDVFRVLEMPHKIRGKCLIGNIEKLPRTVDEAVERLIREYSLEDKTNIANMTENELMTLQFTLGSYISSEFGIYTGNRDLRLSSKLISGDVHLDPDYVPPLIIKELWKRLRESHKLRVVK
jgi:hypothetical protein